MKEDQKTILCISSYEKGQEFIRQAKREGARVILVTSQSLQDADWPRESLDEIYYMPDIDKKWDVEQLINSVSFLARSEDYYRIVALDDFDVEKAARLREHLRVPGMGDTTARYFRDKLAMRMRAREAGINVPDFVHILNHSKISEYLKKVAPPYVLKPRFQAGAIGIKKIEKAEQLWDIIEKLGDQQSYYLLEKFVHGDIYHVDTIIYNEEILFALSHKYGLPPMEVAHEGRVFSSRTVKRGSPDDKKLLSINKSVLGSLGLRQGISHSEYIKAHEDGKFYFLETSARVGGANLAELIEAASGINLWAEWAKIELHQEDGTYKLPPLRKDYGGIMISLAKQEWPDLSGFDDSEVYWKLRKKHHAGIIVKSLSPERVDELMSIYTEKFYRDFFTSQPLKDNPDN